MANIRFRSFGYQGPLRRYPELMPITNVPDLVDQYYGTEKITLE